MGIIKRLPTDYTTIDQLEYLDSNDLMTIELKARALSFEECLDVLGIADMSDLYAPDLDAAKRAHRRGRAMAIADAADSLFATMKNRTGYVASMDYLRQMSGTFKAEVTPSGTSQSGFKFNVILGGEEEAIEDKAS